MEAAVMGGNGNFKNIGTPRQLKPPWNDLNSCKSLPFKKQIYLNLGWLSIKISWHNHVKIMWPFTKNITPFEGHNQYDCPDTIEVPWGSAPEVYG